MAGSAKTNTARDNVVRCNVCGTASLASAQASNFYANKNSSLYIANGSFLNVCKECCERIYSEAAASFDCRTAVMMCCHYFDYYFSESACEKFERNGSEKFESYIKSVRAKCYGSKTFADSLREMSAENESSANGIAESPDKSWSRADNKNRMRIVDIYKYDPFEGAPDDDRRRMFNLCSDYLVDEDFINDSHKLQGVLEIVTSYNQIHHINEEIDRQIQNGVKDPKLFDSLVAAKKSIMASINQFAKDNGISASLSSKGIKGSSSLAAQVKALEDMHFTDAEINLFNIETCESFRQTADISNASILSQLYLSDDEKLAMVAEQSKTITSLKSLNSALKEQNRLMSITLNKYGKETPLKETVDKLLTDCGEIVETEGCDSVGLCDSQE